MNKPKLIVVFYGRFQPPHVGHVGVYNHLVSKFGKNNVYIGSSNKTDKEKSPLTFQWKQKIFRTLGIPANRLIQTKRNYSVDEMQQHFRFDPENTIFIAAVGEKDGQRLSSGKYYLPYKGGRDLAPAIEHAYYYAVPNVKSKDGKVLNATSIRNILRKDELSQKDYGYLKANMGVTRAMVDNLKPLFECVGRETKLISEGGAGGHMSHPYEDTNITFAEMQNMIVAALDGSLSKVEVTEKVDGQNLFASIINGKIRLARNKTQLKSKGSSSMTIEDIAKKWSNIPEVKDAFTSGAKELEKTLLQLSKDELDEIFENGKNWINIEVIWHTNPNVIDYDQDVIMLHNLVVVDENGNGAGINASLQSKLFSKVKSMKSSSGRVKVPEMMKIKPHNDFSSASPKYIGMLKSFMRKQGVGMSDNLGEWLKRYWTKKILSEAKSLGVKLDSGVVDKIAKRFALGDKSYTLHNIKRDLESAPLFTKMKEMDKTSVKVNKAETEPLEILFLKLGAEVLRNVENFLTANPDKTLDKLKKDIQAQISKISSSKNIEDLEKMRVQLRRIQAIGGLEKIIPSEGIVFKWNGKVYKLTGLYAPINQIMGIGRFGR